MAEKRKEDVVFIMMVGVPGSGKSYKAKHMADTLLKRGKKMNIHSSDNIREELFGDANSQENNALVFQTLHSRVFDDLSKGESCIYDATNLSSKRRKEFLEQIEKFCCTTMCLYINPPIEKCHEQNESRERKVPRGIIRRMINQKEEPSFSEGWDNIFEINGDIIEANW